MDSRSSCGTTPRQTFQESLMHSSYVFIALALIAVIVVARTATVVLVG